MGHGGKNLVFLEPLNRAWRLPAPGTNLPESPSKGFGIGKLEECIWGSQVYTLPPHIPTLPCSHPEALGEVGLDQHHCKSECRPLPGGIAGGYSGGALQGATCGGLQEDLIPCTFKFWLRVRQ